MSLFRKNPNEVAFTGEKKHWTDVIKNTGPGELLIWRQPEEDFNINSTLIVLPGEKAIFIKGGNIEQMFESGTYRLSTENYPVISRLRNAFSGGVSTFNCVVYFFRDAHSAEILWGTDSPIQLRDKMLGIATKIGSHGSYKIQIVNPGIFLTKLIGNNVLFSTQTELNKYLINEFQSKIKSSIARAIDETNAEIIGIDTKLDLLSEAIQPILNELVKDYGLRIVNFSISAINILDDDLRRRYDEIGIDAIAKMRNAQADKSVMGILGDDWLRQQTVNITGDIANNTGAGGIAAVGAGIGMGFAANNIFSNMSQQVFTPMEQTSQPKSNSVEAIKQLKEMYDIGAITQEEFNAKKQEIIGRM